MRRNIQKCNWDSSFCLSGTKSTLCMCMCVFVHGCVCVCDRKVSLKTGSSIISMQAGLAEDQTQPSPLQQEPQTRFSCRVDLMSLMSKAPSPQQRDTKARSHFHLHSFVTEDATVFFGSLIMLSFVLVLNSFFFHLVSLLALTLSLPSSLHSNIVPLFLSTSITFLFMPPIFHLLSCLISPSPGDRVQVTDDSNEEWWKVGNKSLANIYVLCASVYSLMPIYVLVCIMCT